jgi:tetratricopeptide (TPR) repeat protein
MKNWNAAIEVYSQWIIREPSDTDLLEKRASAHIAIEQWEQALGDLQRVVATNPERTESVYERVRQTERWQEALPFGRMLIANQPGAEPELVWLRVAPVAALAGEASYREFCQQLLPLFQNTQDPLVADRFIKACLLRPGCVDTKSLPIGTLARSLDENTLADWAKPWLWTTRALFAYRSGDPQSTLAYAELSESMNPAPSIHGLNLALVALAEHELRHEEKSESLLGELSQMISQQKNTSGNLSHDFLIIEVLYREAKAKMEKP